MRLVRRLAAPAVPLIWLAIGGAGGAPGYLRAADAQSIGPASDAPAAPHRGCLSFHQVHPEIGANRAQQHGVPAGFKIYPQQGIADEGLLLKETPVVAGGELADAEAAVDPMTSQPAILLQLGPAGARKLADFTRESLGQRLAIVIDGRVISAPLIREPIEGGRAQVSGSLTRSSAAEIAARLRSRACRDG